MSNVAASPEDTATMSAGHLMVRQLEAAGIPRVYSVPGESFLDILDGLYDSPIHNVVARHEGGAGFMALAEGRLTGVPGVAMVTRGPGAANALIAVHTAYQDQTPLVLFIGLIPIADRNRESFQEFDPRAWFGSTAKKVLVLEDADSAAELVDDALYTAVSGRPGPVIIGVPEDVLRHHTAKTPVSPRSLARPAASEAQLAQLDTLLANATRPMIVVGGDGWNTELGQTLGDWASERNIPIASDFRAYDAVPHHCRAWIGSLGYSRCDTTAAAFDRADLLIFVGAVRSDALSDGYTLGNGSEVATVVIDPDPELLGHWGGADLVITAAPAEAVPQLTARSVTTAAPAAWLTEAREAFERFRTPPAATPGVTRGVDLAVAVRELNERLNGDATITMGAGNHALWSARYIAHNRGNSLVGPRNGAMGVGVPAAVAAALVHPEKTVVSLAGDGCFMMNGNELATARAVGARIHIIVVDNGIFATIRDHQEAQYPGRPSGTAMTNPDFAVLAQAHGMYGERVTRTEDFAAALDRALASETGSVLHLEVAPELGLPSTDPNADALR